MSLSLFLALSACGMAVLASLSALLLRDGVQRSVLCLLLASAGALAIVGGIAGLMQGGSAAILPLGLPWLPMHVKLDALGSFFLLVVGALLLPVAIYSNGYLKGEQGLTPLAIFLPLFILGMLGVLLADDAFTFMLYWELMSISSYFLVIFRHENKENRKAGFIYMLMAHLAGLLILGAFAVLYAASGSFEFSVMRSATITPFWASIAFLLAGFGFGTKAGVAPLHGWLPAAHPVAPSNISALMSGIMLKVAIFGFMRVVWDLMGPGDFQWWWGTLVLAAGTVSAVTGVLMALQQNDVKRLLAYSSIENIGIILIGLGLALLLAHFEHPTLAALGLIAALYHTINHALFKGLLFMGAGALLHSTGTRDMESMGGLIHRMPWTAVFFLVGCMSISGLPPFNGFVSEWLIFQTSLLAPQLGGALLTAIVPFSAAILALAGALAAACFVKVFGVVFLGQARSQAAISAHEVDIWMKIGMFIPALFCLILGLSPVWFIPMIDIVPQSLLHVSLATSIHANGWLWLSPGNVTHSSYSAPVVLAGMLAIGGAIFWFTHPKGTSLRRSVLWSCGNPHVQPSMQYTSTSFSQPLRRIFCSIYLPDEHAHITRTRHLLLTDKVQYVMHVTDVGVKYIYQPIGQFTLFAAKLIRREHQRGIHAYLAYTFFTIIFLLAVYV